MLPFFIKVQLLLSKGQDWKENFWLSKKVIVLPFNLVAI